MIGLWVSLCAVEPLQQWLQDNDWLWWALGTFSVVSLLVALCALPWLLTQIRSDYFLPDRSFESRRPKARLREWILRNVVGALLVLLGIIWLVTPGQGLITILVGLVFMDFPGKRKLELWVVRLPKVLEAANWLRAKRGSEPFLMPPRVAAGDPGSTGR